MTGKSGRKRACVLSLLSLAALVVPLAAQAQEASASEAQPGDIVVLGTGLPLPPGTPAYGSTVIDNTRLNGSASGRTEDILADVAGFEEFRRSDSRSANPSAQGVTLRALGGNATSRTLVLLDGVPQADPFFGYIPFNAIAPDRLSAIRVTRGGGAGAFGAGAVAGTIEMFSATRADLPRMTASAFYGSRDSVMLSGSVSPDVGGGFVSLSGNYDRGDGFYTTPEDQRVPATVPARYEDWSANLRAVAPIDAETELQARAVVYRDSRTLRFAGADGSSAAQDASLRLVHRGPWQIDALAYLQTRNFTNKVISASSYKLVLDQRNTPSIGLGGKIELRPPVGSDHVLRLGLDARLSDGELHENPYSAQTGRPTADRHAGGRSGTLGLFAEDDWTLGRLVLTGGVRGDRWTIANGFYHEVAADTGAVTSDERYPDRSGFETTARIGALYKASAAIALRAAGYTGFRLPTLNELYRPFTVFPITTEANADLGLERLKGAEAGIDLTPASGVTIGATLFYNRLDNAIANVTIGTNLRQRRNVDAIVAKGIELTARAVRGPFSLSASYAYDHSIVHGAGESAALDGYVPAQSPQHSASATLAWRAPSGAGASATLRYVGKQYEDDQETEVLPHALTVDGVVELPLRKGVTLVGRAENLFDATVITRDESGSVDLGTPRTLWIGIRFRG
jgi:iron complex outermembrane receptor protein